MTRIAVVGAGAAGTLVALHLLQHAATGTLHLTLIDPDRRTGPGVPYRTADPRHLLNVPAGKLSVTAAEPADFVAWLAENGLPEASPEDFVPRELFGRYLSSAFEGARGDRVTRVHYRAVAVARHAGGLSVALCNGDEVHADTVVLAAGPNTPGTSWAPDWLRRSALFVSDPWRAGVLDNLPEDGDLLLVGTGLTMADLACTLRRPGRILHAISRGGLLPRAHRLDPHPPARVPAFVVERGDVLEQAVRYVRDVISEGADMCAAVDALRPHVGALWAGMSMGERECFLRKYRRLWDIHRHRMAPRTAAQIDGDTADGALRVHRAELQDVVASDSGVAVTLSTGQVLHVRAVINCTGPQYDLTAGADRLWNQLLADGLARPGPLNLGLDTDTDGRLLPGVVPMWAIGPLRRGNLWETTAFAEIRAQAEKLAALIGS
ncbi:FAD/NAD(P)-binding protein [Mycobacteroides chelonae]|uniref:Lycopene cyclase n=1 Tax=Mycobacteroides chelonae TaxID=1774 RepID=A0A1S1M4F9_MYCCH|nr:FAD/NAD(P)-binding protein [Mycobacteroides chelonae]OHU79519.1 lycopene cyclase [Mycobacteroides chelonae]QQG89468.1 lycopene cyclase [Mycobacteroides chelonae]QQG94283.1 lycopene cyclase [Mycobacteroides chelonae]